MKTSFVSLLYENQDAFTWNGAKSLSGSGNSLVDLFFKSVRIPSGNQKNVRHEDFVNPDFINYLSKSWNFNPEATLRTLAYIRDVRQGKGEKALFYVAMKWLYSQDKDVFMAMLQLVPHYGSWKDLLEIAVMLDKDDVTNWVVTLFTFGLESNEALCAKWSPSENSYYDLSLKFVSKITKMLNINRKGYRKLLSSLRKVVETQMSKNQWEEINYEHTPSRAAFIYQNSFKRHDYDRYKQFLESVENGEKKINASTLMAHEIVVKYLFYGEALSGTDEVLWKTLVNEYKNTLSNTLVVADVSGSMTGIPMSVAISLAIFSANALKGPYNGHFMTFSNEPTLQYVNTKLPLHEQIEQVNLSNWSMSTNIQAVFDTILSTAVKNNVPQDELPSTIVIISDMQFNKATKNNSSTNFEHAKQKFKLSGYELPKLVFWQVNGMASDVPVSYNEQGVVLLSGYSQQLFKSIATNKLESPLKMVLDVIGSVRYDPVGEILS